MRKDKSYFITLEGGEGSGKTTLQRLLAQFLTGQGREVVLTREPGGTHLSETIRDWLLHQQKNIKIGSRAELLLFLAARAQHIEEIIEPALQSGKIVLCDRFHDSTIAYQGAGRGLGMEEVEKLCTVACNSFTPDLTLLLDVSPEVGLIRAQRSAKKHAAAGSLDRIEAEDIRFHDNIRQAFKKLADENPDRIHLIATTNQSQEEIYRQAVSLLQKYIS